MAAAGASGSARGVPRVAGAEAEFDFQKVVSIDFGTYGCAYCIAFRPATGTTADVSRIELNIGAPGDAGSAGASKSLTAILLDAKTENVVSIGAQARKKFAELTDDGKEKTVMYFEHFKMHMSPDQRRVKPLAVTIPVLGMGGAKPLLLPVSKHLAKIREEVQERIRLAGGAAADKIGWVLTVPAIWDDQAKGFMRAAAKAAGITDRDDAPNLMLALEPECAAIESLLMAPPDLRARFSKGDCVMIVDCGGGTVDCTVSAIVSVDPLQLHEVVKASGGPWGGRSVDESFLEFLRELLGAERFAESADALTMVEILESWEEQKRRFDPAEPNDYRIELSSVDAKIGQAALTTAIEAYNRRNGCTTDDNMLKRTKKGHLVLQQPHMKRIFDKSVEPILTHVDKLVRDTRAARKEVKFLLLVGGFAESKYLVQRVRARFGALTLIVPERAQQVVVRGAARFGLYPRAFITSRIARYSYAISISELWNPRLHAGFECRRIRADNGTEFCDYVLRPLVQQGDSVPVDEPRMGRGFKAVKRAQLEIGIRIFRIDGRVPEVTSTERRMVVVPDGVSIPGGVHESAKVAEVVLKVADNEAVPLEDRVVDVAMYFGRTEIVVNATSTRTGETKFATITFT